MLKFRLSCLTIGLFIACSEQDKNTSNPQTSQELYRIVAGKVWIYDTERYLDDSLVYRSADTLVLNTAQILWGGAIWTPYVGQTGTYWRNALEGVWRLKINPNYPTGLAELIYAYPARAGEAWTVPSDDDSVSVVSASEQVTVPAGAFGQCYYYRFKRADNSRIASVWIQPGVGIVQQSELVIAGADTLRATMKLKAY